MPVLRVLAKDEAPNDEEKHLLTKCKWEGWIFKSLNPCMVIYDLLVIPSDLHISLAANWAQPHIDPARWITLYPLTRISNRRGCWLFIFQSCCLSALANEVCAVNGTAVAEYCRDDLGCVAIPSKCLNSVFDQPVHWVIVRTFWEISVRAVLGIHIAIGLANCANEGIFWQDVGIAPCDTKHVSLLNAGFHASFIKANIRMIRLVKSSSTHPGHKCSMP